MATTMVHVRVDAETKLQAARALAEMGMSVSDAVRTLLIRVAAEKALPFKAKVPNAITIQAMKDSEDGKDKRHESLEELFEELGI